MFNRKSFAMRGMVLTGAMVAFGLTAGCTDDKPATTTTTTTKVKEEVKKVPTTPTAAKDPASEATAIFASRCVLCHGATGKGDGVGAAGLNPKPRDMTKAEWQTKATDAHIAKVIVGGGPSAGLSASMPPNPDLADKKAVVDEIVKLVRAMKK